MEAPDGSPFNGFLYLTLALQGASTCPASGGPTEVLPNIPVIVKVASGVLVSPPKVWGADCLFPVGIPYNVQTKDLQGNLIFNDQWMISGTTFDVGGSVSIFPPPVTSPVLGTIIVGFVIGSGVTGTNVGPMLLASRTGYLARCVVVVKASDSSTPLTFRINKNGSSVFTTLPTIAAGVTQGSVFTFTALTASPYGALQNDVFTIDITSGSPAWQFTAQME
jgi:hypothetical protein